MWAWVSVPFYPTIEVDLIVTALLLVTYITAVYLNALVLWPRLWKQQKRWEYLLALIPILGGLTLIVLAMIRLTYSETVGPERLGPYWQHFAIDLFGMTVHVAGAAGIMWFSKQYRSQIEGSAC
jgi:hypothetical protein